MARILLAEDEELIRLLLVEEFTEHGHEVVDTGSAEEALQHADVGQCCDVLVTDIHMGGKIDGIELARRLRTIHPGLPTIYMTGRPGALVDRGDLGPHDVLVRKPFTVSDIMSALLGVLPTSQ